MKKLFIVLALAVISACSGTKASFHIYGTVENPELEGARIFLVPMNEKVIEPTKENLDSTWIKNGRFEFHGNVSRLADLRIERRKRHGVQNLLVITEPGNIYVTIGKVSCGYGTPQNDSLQVWKDMSVRFRKQMSAARDKAERDSLIKEFDSRTREMAHNCGDSTEVGAFLRKM